MRKKKLIIYNILTILLLLNTYYLYFGHGLGEFSWSTTYLKEIAMGLFSIILILLMNFFVTMSYVSSRVLVKKNYLRINFVLLILIIITGFIFRIKEIIDEKYLIMNWLNTFIYVILMVLIVLMLKELYKLIQDLFIGREY